MRLLFDCFIILGGFNQKLHSRYERDVPAVSKEAVAVPLARAAAEKVLASRPASFFKTSKDSTGRSKNFPVLTVSFFKNWKASLECSQGHVYFGSRAYDSVCVCVSFCLVNPPNLFCNCVRESSRIYCVQIFPVKHF